MHRRSLCDGWKAMGRMVMMTAVAIAARERAREELDPPHHHHERIPPGDEGVDQVHQGAARSEDKGAQPRDLFQCRQDHPVLKDIRPVRAIAPCIAPLNSAAAFSNPFLCPHAHAICSLPLALCAASQSSSPHSLVMRSKWLKTLTLIPGRCHTLSSQWASSSSTAARSKTASSSTVP